VQDARILGYSTIRLNPFTIEGREEMSTELEHKVVAALVKLKSRFMNAQDVAIRMEIQLGALEILESLIDTRQIELNRFLGYMEMVEEWGWDAQLLEIRNLPTK
jgi:hypothetical protein